MSYVFKNYPFTAKTYPPVLPTLVDGRDEARHAVTIVGAGPVGLATALGLANHGVPSVVIEADDSVCFGSRAICLSRRSLEIIQRLGALDSFKAKGLPWTGGRSYYRDIEVLHFRMPHDEDQKLPPMLNIEQFYIEQFLLDEAEKRPGLIDIRWGCRAVGLHKGDDGATLSLSTDIGSYDLQTDWLVACDGGRSFVREAMGLEMKGVSYEGRYVIVDVSLQSERPTERLAWFDPPSNPGSSILMHKQPDDVWRIDYQIGPDEDPEEAVKPENVIPRVKSHLDMIGETGDWSPIWITIYRAHALSLEHYRHGRVLFAGDAAHLVPIFGVRGANSGIDDADNLAWKLALTVKGAASDRVLDSFSSERVAATADNLSYGTKSTEFMAPPSFSFAAMRDAVLSLAVRHDCVRPLINPRQSATITYTGSPLNDPRDESARFRLGPVPGAVLQECPVQLSGPDGSGPGHLTDLVGPRFNLLCFTVDGADTPEMAAIAQAMATHPAPFGMIRLSGAAPAHAGSTIGFDRTGRLFPMYDAQPGTCYLTRPDGHVVGRWRDLDPAVVLATIDRVLTPQLDRPS